MRELFPGSQFVAKQFEILGNCRVSFPDSGSGDLTIVGVRLSPTPLFFRYLRGEPAKAESQTARCGHSADTFSLAERVRDLRGFRTRDASGWLAATIGVLVVFPGGIPLNDEAGAVTGAVGVSGGSPDQDYAVGPRRCRANILPLSCRH